MKRQTGIALATAALIGTTGGVVVAVAGDRSPAAGLSASPMPTSVGTTQSSRSTQTTVSPSATSSTTSSPAPSTSSPAPSEAPFGTGVDQDNTPLLYVAGKKIHDGDEVIPISDIDGLRVTSVDRLSDGYLVGTSGYGDQENMNLHLVDSNGNTRHLARTTYSYDINLAKPHSFHRLCQQARRGLFQSGQGDRSYGQGRREHEVS